MALDETKYLWVVTTRRARLNKHVMCLGWCLLYDTSIDKQESFVLTIFAFAERVVMTSSSKRAIWRFDGRLGVVSTICRFIERGKQFIIGITFN